MRGRVFGAKPSRTKAVQFVNNTTHRQQPPSQPNPTKYASDGVISCPVNEVSTSSNKPKMNFHILQTKSRNAAEKSDENQPPGQPQPASTGPESSVSATAASTSTTSACDQSLLRQHHKGHPHRSEQPQPASTGPESTVSATTRAAPRPAPAIRATFASTTKGTPIGQSVRIQHHKNQSQRPVQ